MPDIQSHFSTRMADIKLEEKASMSPVLQQTNLAVEGLQGGTQPRASVGFWALC